MKWCDRNLRDGELSISCEREVGHDGPHISHDGYSVSRVEWHELSWEEYTKEVYEATSVAESERP